MMICPRCGQVRDDGIRFCTRCGSHLEPEVTARPAGKGTEAMTAVAVMLLLLAAGAAFLVVTEERDPSVILISDGMIVGSVSVAKGGTVNEWLSEIGDTLVNGPLRFAGWYTDASLRNAFYEMMPIERNITLYAKWSALAFSMEQSFSPAVNRERCTFQSDIDGVVPVSWEVKDSYKTNNTPTFTGNNEIFSADLPPGRYFVTMTVSETEKLTKTVTVGGVISSVSSHLPDGWKDYSNIDRTLDFSFDVTEYLIFAEKNRERYYRHALIGTFVVVTDTIEDIADSIDIMFGQNGTGKRQDLMDLVASFVNNTTKNQDKNRDSFYYGPPGHVADNIEYYKYPMESLYDRLIYDSYGDCEDHAILTAAIAMVLDFDVAIIIMTNPSRAIGHAVAGITDPSFEKPTALPNTMFCSKDGYYACETFRPGQRMLVGLIGSEFRESDGWVFKVVPVK